MCVVFVLRSLCYKANWYLCIKEQTIAIHCSDYFPACISNGKISKPSLTLFYTAKYLSTQNQTALGLDVKLYNKLVASCELIDNQHENGFIVTATA